MNVGIKVRRMREAQDLTYEQVGEMTGFAPAYIEAIEKGEEIPPIGAVIKISRAFGSRMGQLIHHGGPRPDIFSIISTDEAEQVERLDEETGAKQGYTYASLLSSGIRGQAMEPFMVTFDSDAGDSVQSMAHEGEEFLHILSGTIELIYDEGVHTLNAGDNVYIDSSRPHAIRGVGKPNPVALAVIYSKD